MFRINRKKCRKPSKQKVESKQKYQEDFNEIILNDLVPEEKRKEFGLDSKEEPKIKKSGKMKLNLGLGGKKSSSSKKTNQESEKGNKHNKNKQNKNKQQSTKHNGKNNKKGSNIPIKDKNLTKKTNNKTKATKPSQYNIEEKEQKQLIEETNKINKKKHIGLKKERVKSLNKENNDEINRNLEENKNKDVYKTEDNFDSINFKRVEVLEEKTMEEPNNDENLTNRFEDLVWSKDKFPKK